MKKVIVKVDVHGERMKQKCLKAVRGLKGVESAKMGENDQKMTVIGDVDPVDIVRKLRKLCSTEILSIGPAEEEEPKKKEEPKKDKKEKEPLTEEPKKDKEEKEPEKEEPKKEKEMAELVKAYQAYNPYMTQQYFGRSAEEDPNACAIC